MIYNIRTTTRYCDRPYVYQIRPRTIITVVTTLESLTHGGGGVVVGGSGAALALYYYYGLPKCFTIHYKQLQLSTIHATGLERRTACGLYYNIIIL